MLCAWLFPNYEPVRLNPTITIAKPTDGAIGAIAKRL
jgi:hypothetical protein